LAAVRDRRHHARRRGRRRVDRRRRGRCRTLVRATPGLGDGAHRWRAGGRPARDRPAGDVADGDMGLLPYGAEPRAGGPATAGAALERTTLRDALGTAPFWLLAGSFWVCGYTSTGLILTHLIPHATEHGFHGGQAAQALGLMGAFNIVGTILSGWICDRYGQKVPLACYYALRGVSLLFLPFVGTMTGLLAWAVVFGLNYISTVPGTTALTAKIYGRHSVGELSGWIFFSHGLVSGVGPPPGAILNTRFGNYAVAFHWGVFGAFAATQRVLGT